MLGRDVFPGVLIMRKRGMHGEFKEVSLVGRAGLGSIPWAPVPGWKRSAEVSSAETLLASLPGAKMDTWFPHSTVSIWCPDVPFWKLIHNLHAHFY